MAAANLTYGFTKIPIEGSEKSGTILFGGVLTAWFLKQVGNSYTLTFNPCLFTQQINQTIQAVNVILPTIDKTIMQQIPVITSDGTLITNTVGIFMMSSDTITIYSSIGGTPFNQDTTNLQGWSNAITINFAV